MNGRWILLCSLLALLMAAFGAAQAGDNDPNICNGSWAGQCTTQRDWEAGWCYANVDEATCDSLYGDIRGSMNGAPVNASATSTSTTTTTASATAANTSESAVPAISHTDVTSAVFRVQ